jgi:hypothetical protein
MSFCLINIFLRSWFGRQNVNKKFDSLEKFTQQDTNKQKH